MIDDRCWGDWGLVAVAQHRCLELVVCFRRHLVDRLVEGEIRRGIILRVDDQHGRKSVVPTPHDDVIGEA